MTVLSEKNSNLRLGRIDIGREQFENGFTLVSNETKETETVAISGSIKAGTIRDQPGSFGAAELVSRLLMRGTTEFSAGQISQKIEEVGATLSFENRDESVNFSGRCYNGVLDEVLVILADCLMNPTFPESEIALARNEILSEIKAEEDDTRSMAFRRIAELVFGKDAPYGRDSLGRPDELMTLTRSNLTRFHQENYSPDGLIVAMTGGYDFDDVRDKVDGLFSSWNNSSASKFSYYDTGPVAPNISVVEMKHKTQVDLAIGTKAVPRSSHDYYPLNLGNLILGRLGLYGRLGKNIREERGLAYYSFSTLQAKLFSGMFAAFAGVNPANVKKAIEGIFQEISKITTEPLHQKELETAKRNSVGSLSISLDTSSERVNILHDIEYNGLGLDYLERFPSILDRISSEEILGVFQKYVKSDRLSMVATGPVDNQVLADMQTVLGEYKS
jgi:zinc protease